LIRPPDPQPGDPTGLHAFRSRRNAGCGHSNSGVQIGSRSGPVDGKAGGKRPAGDPGMKGIGVSAISRELKRAQTAKPQGEATSFPLLSFPSSFAAGESRLRLLGWTGALADVSSPPPILQEVCAQCAYSPQALPCLLRLPPPRPIKAQATWLAPERSYEDGEKSRQIEDIPMTLLSP